MSSGLASIDVIAPAGDDVLSGLTFEKWCEMAGYDPATGQYGEPKKPEMVLPNPRRQKRKGVK